jgi:hypothetical protein
MRSLGCRVMWSVDARISLRPLEDVLPHKAPRAASLLLPLLLFVSALIASPSACVAQFGPGASLTPFGAAQVGRSGAVSYAADAQQVRANQPAVLELRFHVAPGFHINSSRPKSDLLLPTWLEALPILNVKQQKPVYPAGIQFSFPTNPNEKLDVYSGDFIVKLPVNAELGSHEIGATLHYQACDESSCFPPKSLNVPIIFFAK